MVAGSDVLLLVDGLDEAPQLGHGEAAQVLGGQGGHGHQLVGHGGGGEGVAGALLRGSLGLLLLLVVQVVVLRRRVRRDGRRRGVRPLRLVLARLF